MTLLKPISAALTGLVLIGGAYAAYDQIRPWPTVGEFYEVAGVSITTAINQKYDILAYERRELRLCKQQGQNCIEIQRRIQRLEQQIMALKAKRAKYGG